MTLAEKLALENKRRALEEKLTKDKGGLTQPILGKSEMDGTAPFGTSFNVAQQHKADELFDNDEKVKQKAISDAQKLYMLRGGGDEFRTALTIADTNRSKNKESGDTSDIYHNTISDIYKESYFSELQKAPTLDNYKKFIDAQGRSPYASGSYKGNDALAVATSIMYSGNKDFKYEDDAFAKKLFGEEENRILTMERERDSKVKAQKESTSLYENLKDTQDDIADMAIQFGAFAGFREQADKATDRIKERSIKNNEEKKEKAKRGAEISALGDEIAYRKANLEFHKQYYQLSKAKDFNEYNHNIPGKNIAVYHPQIDSSLDTMFDMAEYDENGVNFLGLTKEQVELFYYIGNTQGSKAAQKYIDTLLPLTAPESAKYRYNMVKDIPVIKQIDGTVQNLAGGLGGAIEGLINAGTSVAGKTFEFKVDPMTGAQPYIENAKGAEKVLYGVAQGTGQMLPTIGASFINPGLGKAVFGTSVYGNSYKEARKRGYSQSASFGYGMANAGLELALESIGGFSFGGKGKISYGGRLASKLDDVFKASPKMRAMAAIGGKAAVDYASEFSEEYLAEVFSPALGNIFLKENNEIKLYSDAHLEAGIIGGFTGLLLQSPSYVQSVARTFKKGSYGAESAFYLNAADSVLEGEMYKGNSKVFEGLSKAEKAKAIEAYRKEKLYGAAYKAIFGHISQGVLEGCSLGTIMSDISAEGIDISEFEGDIRNAYSVALASNGADARLDRAIEEGLASHGNVYDIVNGIAADKALLSQISDFNNLEGEALLEAISQRVVKVSESSHFLNEARALISQGEPTAYIIDSLISRGGRYVLPFTVDGAIDMAKAESLISGIRNSVIADEVNKRGLTGLDANHYIREAILRDRAADRVYSLARDGFSYEEARVTEGALASLLTDEQFSNVFARGQSVYNVEKKQKDAERTAQLSEAPIEDVDNDKGDTLDDSSIVLEKDESSYPYDEKTVIDGYEKAVDSRILDFINRVRGLKDERYRKTRKIEISKLDADSKTSKDISSLVGFDVSGFSNVLTGNALMHIDKDHGKNGATDHSMANDNDLARIGFVVDNYDSIELLKNKKGELVTDKEHRNNDGTPSAVIKMSKKINGTYYVVEAVSNAEAKKVYVKSAYISKKNGSTSEMLNMPENEPAAYVRKSPVQSDTTTNNSISLSEEDVKSILDGVGSYGKTVYDRIVDKAVKKAVDGGEGVTEAKKGVLEAFAHIYKAGMDGKAISKKYVDTYFSRSQVNEIYDAGKRDAESHSNVARKKNARLIKDEALRKAKLSSREVKMLEALAKICGRDIRFSEELHGNAKINLNTGEIVISTEAKNGIRWAAVHEVFHALRADNPAEANRLIRVVCDILEKNKGLFNAVKAKYADTYLSDLLDSDGHFKENFIDIIEEEIAADMIGYVISNSEALAKITGEQRNVLQRFIDRLSSFFSNDDKYLKKLSPELRRAFREVYKEVDVIAEQFTAAIEKQSEVVKEKGVEVERNEKKTSGEEVKKSRDISVSITNEKVEIDLSENNELTARIKGLEGSQKYKVIRDFIIESIGSNEFVLSDGVKAKVDRSDALHIANKSANRKTTYIAKIKDLISKAKLHSVETDVIHNKFDEFRYYEANVKYSNEVYPIYLNVGKAKNGDGYHLYDITKKIGGFAKHKKALERVNKDLRSENESPTNHYTQNDGNVNTDNEKNSRDLSEDISERDIFKPSEKEIQLFADTVDKWFAGEMKSDEHFRLGNTSTVLKQLGARDLPVIMSQDVIVKMTGGKHSISLDEIKHLPEAIYDPIMVFDSATVPNSFVLVTELTDKSGNSVVAALHLSKKQKRLLVNRVASVYGKNNIASFIETQSELGNLRYIDKEKCQQWSTNRGLQLPKLVQSITDNDSILQKEDIVNSNISQNDEKHSKDLTEQEMSENKISTLAGHIRQKYKSSFEKDTLIEELRGIYKLYKEENYSSANDRAMELGKAILSQVKSEKVIDENAKSILKDIRNRRIRVSDTQIAEAKYLFGNSWRDRFFGRVIFTNKAKTSLDQQWQEWCELYPQYFKSDVNDADMILQLSEILDNLKKQAQYSVPVETSSMLAPILKDIMEGVFSSGVEKKYANRMSEAERRQVLDEILSTSLKRWGVDIGRVEQSPGMSIEETVKKVKDSFGINITDGGDASVSGKGILDSYNVDSKTIRTKFKNDLPSIAHALGYHIESKLSVIDKVIEQTEAVRTSNGDGIGEFERELLTMSTSADADSRTRIREGFAEFIRMYLTSKPLALDAAPIFYSFFEAQLKADSELSAAVEASAEAISGYFAQSFGDRAESAIMTAEEWKKLNKPRGKEAAMRLRNWVTVRLVDRFYGIKNAEKLHGTFDLTTSKNAYVRATLSLQSRGRAARILEDGFYDANGNKVGDSYFDIISPLGADYSDKFKDFGNYLTYVHAIEWLEPNDQTGKKTSSGKDIYKAKAKGKVFGDETLNDADKLRSLIARYEAKYSDFKSIARKIYKYQDNLMEYYLIPSGALSRDQAETFRAQYPHYVPFNRFNSVFGDAVGSGKFGATNIFANLKNPIKKADGGNAPIRNPLESIINSTLAAVDFKMKNDTMLALIDEFTGNGSIPGVMERIYSSKELEKLNEKGANPFIVEEGLSVNESKESAFSPVADKEKGIVFAWVNGEKRFYQVYDRDLYNAVANLEVQKLNVFFKVFNTITNALKVTMTMRNPLFGPGNFFRDFMTFHYNTDSNANIFMQLGMYAGAIKSIITQDENFKLYKALGGMDSGKFTADMDAIKRTVRRRNSSAVPWNKMSVRDFGNKVIKNIGGLRFLWDKYFELNDVLETLPRLAEFKYTMDTSSGDVQLAMHRSQDVTTNFSRSGTWGRNLNAIFLFSNAELQGIDKMVRNYSEAAYTGKNSNGEPAKAKIAGKILKTVGWSLFMTALSEFLNRRDEEAEEEYARLSEFTKNNYDVFYIGDGFFAKLPKEQNFAIPRTVMQRIFDMVKGDDVDFTELGSYIWDGITPGFIPDVFDIGNVPHQILNNTPISVITDVAFNRDFKGDEIVPSYMKGAEYQKYNNYTSAFSVNTAKTLYDITGGRIDISPMAIDHYFGAFGYYGSIATNLFPYIDVQEGGIIASAGKNWKDALGLNTKFKVDARYSTDLLDNFYEGAERATARIGIDDTGENRAVNEKYQAMYSFITSYNKQSRSGDDKQQRSDRKLLQIMLEGFTPDELSPGERYVAYLYDVTGNDDVFKNSLPKPEFRETRSKKGQKYVISANLDTTTYAQYCSDIAAMREEARVFVMSLGLDDYEAVTVLIKCYDSINAEMKSRYLMKYGIYSSDYVYYHEEKSTQDIVEKVYADLK